MSRLAKSIALVIAGIAGFLALWVVLDSRWTAEHEKLARELCDAIPVGTSAAVAKQRAQAMSGIAADLEIKELSIRVVFLNPYSPGDMIRCEANIENGKVLFNAVTVSN